MLRSIRGFTIVLVFIFLVSYASAAVAQDIPVVQEGALREDAKWYAARFDVDIDEALRRIQLQLQVGEVNEVLTERIPEVLGGVWIKHEPLVLRQYSVRYNKWLYHYEWRTSGRDIYGDKLRQWDQCYSVDQLAYK